MKDTAEGALFPAGSERREQRKRRCTIIAAWIAVCTAFFSPRAQPPVSSHAVTEHTYRFLIDADSLCVCVFPFGRDGRMVEAQWTLHDGEGKTLRRVFRRGVFRVDVADITGDAFPEILVGVVKRTRFDRVLRLRLAVYRITKNALRPL
ncbi:MAG: hypothetical protein QHI48_08800, partial [Bacteroidota bacterium]|nr:hypothetical protein [Bacteroidota bacterium]